MKKREKKSIKVKTNVKAGVYRRFVSGYGGHSDNSED